LILFFRTEKQEHLQVVFVLCIDLCFYFVKGIDLSSITPPLSIMKRSQEAEI